MTKKQAAKKSATTTRPRASDGDILHHLRREAEPKNQPIVDALRAKGLGASFGRVDRLRSELKSRRRAAKKAA